MYFAVFMNSSAAIFSKTFIWQGPPTQSVYLKCNNRAVALTDLRLFLYSKKKRRRHDFVFFYYIKRDEDVCFKTWRRARGTALMSQGSDTAQHRRLLSPVLIRWRPSQGYSRGA